MKKSKKFYKDKYKKYKKHYKNYYEQNKDKINLQRKNRLRNNWIEYVLLRTKQKCKRKGIDFNLNKKDLTLPKICPILNIPLKMGRKYLYNCPSLDRINNKKGYIKGNVRIISFSANAMKSDMPLRIWNKLEKEIKNV